MTADERKHQDFKWFTQNLEALHKEYGDSYLVIRDKQIIGVYDAPGVAFRETLRKEPPDSFIIQKCGPDESCYTIKIAALDFFGGLK
jgi:hypothetical protein